MLLFVIVIISNVFGIIIIIKDINILIVITLVVGRRPSRFACVWLSSGSTENMDFYLGNNSSAVNKCMALGLPPD